MALAGPGWVPPCGASCAGQAAVLRPAHGLYPVSASCLPPHPTHRPCTAPQVRTGSAGACRAAQRSHLAGPRIRAQGDRAGRQHARGCGRKGGDCGAAEMSSSSLSCAVLAGMQVRWRWPHGQPQLLPAPCPQASSGTALRRWRAPGSTPMRWTAWEAAWCAAPGRIGQRGCSGGCSCAAAQRTTAPGPAGPCPAHSPSAALLAGGFR